MTKPSSTSSHDAVRATIALAAILGCNAIVGLAHADTFVKQYGAPSLDRWNYPFNPTPGTRITASTFGNEPGSALFDNRDGQFIVGFNTAADVPTGLGTSRYQVVTCVVEITFANDFVVEYDSTVDPYNAFLPSGDAQYVEDEDAGQPIEIYGTGFRNGFSLATWAETTPYAPSGTDILSPNVRTAFPIARNASGAWIDVSNSVRNRFTPEPFAVGTIDGLKPGSLIPLGSTMRFDLDCSRDDVQEFLRTAINAGRLRLTVSSLTKVVQQGGNYPQFYCRENPIVGATGVGDATLAIEVSTASCAPADLDCDGSVAASDLSLLLAAWGTSGPADLNGDGFVGAADLSLLLAAWG
ncbi:MAG: hypothetical protein ACKO3W_12810 [bacterium]